MSGAKSPLGDARAPRRTSVLELQTADLMEMASRLSRRDMAALAAIMRRAAEISETDGEEVALAVLDQIQGILLGRSLDA